MKDVAGEDHAKGKGPDQNQRSLGVITGAPRATEQVDAAGEAGRSEGGPDRRREAEAVREHEAGEGSGADGVGVEREPAQDQPRPQEPCPDREKRDLEQPALDEDEVKRRQHTN